MKALSLLLLCSQAWAQPQISQLQRGAEIFMNYCSGCHSLQYLRYQQMAKDLHITETNLNPRRAAKNAPILTAIPPEQAQQWFGIVPPDLSLIAELRGSEWLTAYLNSFYVDNNRPFGFNNSILPEAAMPDVLQNAIAPKKSEIEDVVAFLVYVSDPSVLQRHSLAKYVLGFLAMLLLLIYAYRIAKA